ncbi:MAG: hypothetical protein VKS61_01830 [Candidatus Sericytochromatia bacterium]|nr:hypothetical protein [Candidatus Sericytochromatia bacterium]
MVTPRCPGPVPRQLVALTAGVALATSLGATPAIAAPANAGPAPRPQGQLEGQLPDPDRAFDRTVIGAGTGFLGSVALFTTLGLVTGTPMTDAGNMLTVGSISTLAGALGSSVGHFYAGDPVRGVGLGALGTAVITGASLGGLVLGTALGGSSIATLAAVSFVACTGTLVGWTWFVAGDARHVAVTRGEARLQLNRP